MNGINYSALFTNSNSVNGSTQFKGKLTGTKNAKTPKKSFNEDTVEIDGKSREIPKAGYDRPKATVRKTNENSDYKKIDENGVQEGIELSDGAKKVLEELREKYQNMDIKVINWSSDEEQDYYASRTDKDYSVLIAPEALEAMANDESEKEKYMSILDSAGTTSETLKEELGEDIDKIKNFTISIDQDGKVSYTIQLIKDFEESNKQNTKTIKEIVEEAREERKAKEEEAEKKAEEKNAENKNAQAIKADSLEELISKVKEALNPVEKVTQ